MAQQPAGQWGDLGPRVASAAVMVLVGGLAIWAGGLWFGGLVCAACGIMIWELAAMADPGQGTRAQVLGVLAAAMLAAVLLMTPGWRYVLLMGPPVAACLLASRIRTAILVYGLAIMLACLALVEFRQTNGLEVIAFILLIVVTSDVAGYFAGRLLGGPKFWPRVSPKKTWSGTVAGWIGAAFVGGVYVYWANAIWLIVPLSVLVAFAGQLGDIAESAIKRAVGVKDASSLIPGHGGVLDRFDALIGAALLLLAVSIMVGAGGTS
jgi:phosphatidate cytidylyltransferase